MRHDSRARRITRTWLGTLSAGACLVASAGEPAALTVTARPLLPGPVLIQERPETAAAARGGTAPAATAPGSSAAGSFAELHAALAAARARLEELSKAAEAVVETAQIRRQLVALKEENEQLIAERDAARAGEQELRNARQAAEVRVVELSQALEEMTARAQRIDEELIAVRWENAQLDTSLAQTRAARQEDQARARDAQAALGARVEALEADGAKAAAALARLREQFEEGEQRLLAAGGAQADAETRLAEMRNRLQQAEQETASRLERLAVIEEQLSKAEEQVASAQQDRAAAVQRVAALESERDERRGELAAMAEQLKRAEAANDRLETEVAEARQAAGTATDAARQNLVVVEEQIRALNQALGRVGPSAAEPADAAASDSDGEFPAPSASASIVAAVPDHATSAAGMQAGRPSTDLEAIKGEGGEQNPALLDGLSLEQRLHVRSLVADLNGALDEQGLKMVVPGGILFARDSDEVPESAHDTLAKVAELINMYDDREVRIIGHTDALGDAAYNQTLSERRAGLVKQFFVDEFEVDEARLGTEGMGEARPIASNTTPDGRLANRRVEVVILN
jgi:outer membrane protein OmpA-like peptidoglycan-associated protein